MFKRHMKQAVVMRKTGGRNQYGEEYSTYNVLANPIEIAIAANTANDYKGNDQDILNANYLGVTSSTEIKREDIIVCDSRYFDITHIECGRRFNLVYLKEVGVPDGRLFHSIA